MITWDVLAGMEGEVKGWMDGWMDKDMSIGKKSERVE